MKNTYKYKDGHFSFPWGKVWYRVVGNGAKTPLLIAHGGPGYPSDYLWNLEKLSDQRPVVFYDQSGCGRSDHDLNKKYWTVEHYVEELSAVRSALGLHSIHLFLHSWGTMFGIDYILAEPTGVASVIFASPCLSVPLWQKTTQRYLDALPNGQGALIRKHEREGTTESAEYRAALHAYQTTYECRIDPEPELKQAATKGFNEHIYGFLFGENEYSPSGPLKDFDRCGRLNEIKVPVLFTCGRYDGASPETTEFYRSLIPGAELYIFEESSHFPHLEEEEKYLDKIKKFLIRY